MQSLSNTTVRASLVLALLGSCAIGRESSTVPKAEVIQLHKVEIDQQSGVVTLRWSSRLGTTYAIEETSNSEFGWRESVHDIPGDPVQTSFALRPQHPDDGAKTLLFRVRKSEASGNRVAAVSKTQGRVDSTNSEIKSAIGSASAQREVELKKPSPVRLTVKADRLSAPAGPPAVKTNPSKGADLPSIAAPLPAPQVVATPTPPIYAFENHVGSILTKR